MATLKQVSETEKSNARKVAKLPKKPKKPKRSASLPAMERYIERHNAWADKIKANSAKYLKSQTLVKQIFK